MAEGSLTFSVTGFTTNNDYYGSKGSSFSGTITKTDGTLPPGASFTNAYVKFSSVSITYGTGKLTFGSYGTSEAISNGAWIALTGCTSSILNVSSTSVTVTSVKGGTVNFRAGATITIQANYTYNPYVASTGTLNKTSLNAGESLTVTLSNTYLSSLQHVITYWYSNSYYYRTAKLAKGTTSNSYTIPLSWCNAMPNSTSMSCTVGIITYNGDTAVGDQQYCNFTLNVPSTVKPTISSVKLTRIDNTVPSSWGVYVYNKSGVKIEAVGASGAYSSTISSYTYSGDASWSANASNCAYYNPITKTGSQTFTITVTDSRGRTASATSSAITVYEHSIPTFTSAMAFRCTSDGTASEVGTYAGIRSSCTVSSCNGKNSYTLKAALKVSGTGTYSSDVSIAAGNTSVVGEGGLNTAYQYIVRITATDALGAVATKEINVALANYTMHFKNGGQGVAFGMEATVENAVQISPSWSLYCGAEDLLATIRSLEARIAKLGG